MEVKGVGSPVFASKLCHFILPSAFPVVDGEAVQGSAIPYVDYWERCRACWTGCREKRELRAELRDRMSSEPIVSYPWSTKITELCWIGVAHPG